MRPDMEHAYHARALDLFESWIDYSFPTPARHVRQFYDLSGVGRRHVLFVNDALMITLFYLIGPPAEISSKRPIDTLLFVYGFVFWSALEYIAPEHCADVRPSFFALQLGGNIHVEQRFRDCSRPMPSFHIDRPVRDGGKQSCPLYIHHIDKSL